MFHIYAGMTGRMYWNFRNENNTIRMTISFFQFVFKFLNSHRFHRNFHSKPISFHPSKVKWFYRPDRGVPNSTLIPLNILKLVGHARKRSIVVHCSAGVGRTGTMMAIEMGLRQLLHCVPLNMVELCKELRSTFRFFFF